MNLKKQSLKGLPGGSLSLEVQGHPSLVLLLAVYGGVTMGHLEFDL